MSNMKCPFCQQEMIIPKDDSCFGQQRCVCRNPNCEFDGWHFPVKLVSELICTKELLEIEDAEHSMCHTQMLKTTEKLDRTRKALDVAVDALKTVKRYLCEMPAPDGATVLRMACESATTVKKALEQITALEQKE